MSLHQDHRPQEAPASLPSVPPQYDSPKRKHTLRNWLIAIAAVVVVLGAFGIVAAMSVGKASQTAVQQALGNPSASAPVQSQASQDNGASVGTNTSDPNLRVGKVYVNQPCQVQLPPGLKGTDLTVGQAEQVAAVRLQQGETAFGYFNLDCEVNFIAVPRQVAQGNIQDTADGDICTVTQLNWTTNLPSSAAYTGQTLTGSFVNWCKSGQHLHQVSGTLVPNYGALSFGSNPIS